MYQEQENKINARCIPETRLEAQNEGSEGNMIPNTRTPHNEPPGVGAAPRL